MPIFLYILEKVPQLYTIVMHQNDKKSGIFDLFVPNSQQYMDVYCVKFGKNTSNLHYNDVNFLDVLEKVPQIYTIMMHLK